MEDTISSIKLNKSFYRRNLLIVAKELLGKVLVKKNSKRMLTAKIVEVEAYDGEIDKAAHSYVGKTERNKVMFNEGGFLYVYLSYGVHHCCNVVTGFEDKGTAVLIRAVEPLKGIDLMIKNRFGRKLKNDAEIINLTSGPGKVCKALGINRNNSGIDLTGDEIFLLDQPKLKTSELGISKRIGITKSTNYQWRFYIK
ncbi:MAG: DNA-3-methyladenine glycosylase, partial [Ignavibacteriaceae bacterium]|nr:DNA-3-methyladenine glycosylase [Ignavibacteriaceae bacterium]